MTNATRHHVTRWAICCLIGAAVWIAAAAPAFSEGGWECPPGTYMSFVDQSSSGDGDTYTVRQISAITLVALKAGTKHFEFGDGTSSLAGAVLTTPNGKDWSHADNCKTDTTTTTTTIPTTTEVPPSTTTTSTTSSTSIPSTSTTFVPTTTVPVSTSTSSPTTTSTSTPPTSSTVPPSSTSTPTTSSVPPSQPSTTPPTLPVTGTDEVLDVVLGAIAALMFLIGALVVRLARRTP